MRLYAAYRNIRLYAFPYDTGFYRFVNAECAKRREWTIIRRIFNFPMNKRKKELFCLLERIGLFFFIASLFFNVQKVLIANALSGEFPYNEYLDVSVYLSDIFFFVWLGLFILNNKKYIKSIFLREKMFHVKHYGILYLISLFIGWALLSVFVHSGVFELRLIAFIRLLEGATLFFLILFYSKSASLFHVEHKNIDTVPRGTWQKFCSTWNIKNIIITILYSVAFFNALLALLQFLLKRSLGLSFLGESRLDTALPGVAKVVLFNEVYLRGYGFFAHPNILGGFLGFIIILSLLHWFSSADKVNGQQGFTWNKKEKDGMFHVKLILFLIIGLAFLTTFSKSAFIATFLVMTYLHLGKKMFHVKPEEAKGCVPHETVKSKFHVKRILVPIAIFLFLYSTYTGRELFLKQSFTEREYGYVELAKNINPFSFVGLGIAGYIPHLYSSVSLASPRWLLQPVHNVYFLIYAELGSVGLFLFFMMIFSLWRVSCETGERSENKFHVKQDIFLERFKNGLILYLLLLGVFDHYLWDIPQGIFLFWLILGVGLASKEVLTNNYYSI